MDYITVQKASVKWGVNIRQVQNLCRNGKVSGAIRFNHSWAIPETATKPVDGRRLKTEMQKEAADVKTDLMTDDLRLYKQIFDSFPYSVNVTDTHGVMVYANEMFFEGTLHEARDNALGTYNILGEEMVEQWGLKAHIEKAFRGERVFTPNLELPNRALVGTKYSKNYAFVSIYQDITSFPIFDENNRLKYVVTVFIPVRRYMARDEIVKAKEYIEAHWLEPFDTKQVAKAANLSLSTFLRVFKQETGFSPHDYYMDIKLDHLKEKLLDFNISVAQAFGSCGMDYNSYYTALFKKLTGLTPMHFRKNNK